MPSGALCHAWIALRIGDGDGGFEEHVRVSRDPLHCTAQCMRSKSCLTVPRMRAVTLQLLLYDPVLGPTK